MTEIWKDIVGYEGLYQVSNLGRVKSVDRVTVAQTRWGTPTTRKYKGKILSQGLDGAKHYLLVALRKDYKSITEQVHRLVAKAFIPCNDYSLDVNHKDGCRTNNTLLILV